MGRKSNFLQVDCGRERGERKKKIQDLFLRSMEFRQSEFVKLRVKVNLLDEGYAYIPKSKDFIETSKGGNLGEIDVSG